MRIAAIMDVTNSGRLVPIAMTAIPTMFVETFNIPASFTPWVIVSSPPSAREMIPARINIQSRKVLVSSFGDKPEMVASRGSSPLPEKIHYHDVNENTE